MPFPIPLLLGAAALLFLGKKKSAPARLPATTPPPISSGDKKSGSGYPGVTRERMQEIQTMLISNGYDPGKPDGIYGPKTKQAVMEFQEDWGGLTVDGKPGPNTQAALKEFEASRVENLKYGSQDQIDQCDPLDPDSWGAGNVCYFDGGRWVIQKSETSKSQVPPISAKEVGFSPDYSNFSIGSQFKYGVLDPWLNARRKKGLLVTKYHGSTFVEFFSTNPTSFLSKVFGVGKARGELIYATMFIAASGGLGLGLRAIQRAAVKMAQSAAAKATAYGPMASAMEKVFGTDSEGAAASAIEAAAAFADTHTVLVGNKNVKISSLPGDRDSVKSFSKYIMDYIIKFQKMHF